MRISARVDISIETQTRIETFGSETITDTTGMVEVIMESAGWEVRIYSWLPKLFRMKLHPFLGHDDHDHNGFGGHFGGGFGHFDGGGGHYGGGHHYDYFGSKKKKKDKRDRYSKSSSSHYGGGKDKRDRYKNSFETTWSSYK